MLRARRGTPGSRRGFSQAGSTGLPRMGQEGWFSKACAHGTDSDRPEPPPLALAALAHASCSESRVRGRDPDQPADTAAPGCRARTCRERGLRPPSGSRHAQRYRWISRDPGGRVGISLASLPPAAAGIVGAPTFLLLIQAAEFARPPPSQHAPANWLPESVRDRHPQLQTHLPWPQEESTHRMRSDQPISLLALPPLRPPRQVSAEQHRHPAAQDRRHAHSSELHLLKWRTVSRARD